MKSGLILVGPLLSASGLAAAPTLMSGMTDDIPAHFSETSGVCWDQIDQPSGNGAPDQQFEATYAAYNSEAADDFYVDPAVWGGATDGVNTAGSVTGSGGSIHVNVTFYEDAGGLPGAVVCDYPAVTTYSDVAGDLSITLPSACLLAPSSTYWYAQQVRQDYSSAGQHFWSTRLVANGNGAAWRNPGDGFGTGCVDWAPLTVCGVGGGTSPDFLFQLLAPGCGGIDGGDGGGVPTPAAGPLGLLLMVLALGAGGGYVLVRRRR